MELPLVDRCMHFLVFRAFDKGSKGYLKPEDFVCGLSCLLVGNLNDQMKCKFGCLRNKKWLGK